MVAFFSAACYNRIMKKQEPENVKRFKMKFSPTIFLLCVAVLALCGVGIGISIWRIARFGIKGFNDVIKYPFLIAVCVFCIVIVISILIRSQYVVIGETFITQFGIIKTKFSIKEMTSLLFDRDLYKLSIYFGEQFSVISVSPAWNEELVRALLAVNPSIDYGFTLAEPPKDKTEKDK